MRALGGVAGAVLLAVCCGAPFAAAEPYSNDSSVRWNLLDILPGRDRRERTFSNAEERYREAQRLYMSRADDARAVELLESYVDESRGSKAPLPREEDAKLLLARLELRLSPSEDRDQAHAVRGLRYLREVVEPSREADKQELAMQLLAKLAQRQLFDMRYQARQEKWTSVDVMLDALHRNYPETLSAIYPGQSAPGDPLVKKYLGQIKSLAADDKSKDEDVEAARERVIEKVDQFLSQPPQAAAAPAGGGAGQGIGGSTAQGASASSFAAGAAATEQRGAGRAAAPPPPNPINMSVELRDGVVRELKARLGNWEVRAGTLWADPTTDLAQRSQFVALERATESNIDSKIDYRLRFGAAFADMNTRLFGAQPLPNVNPIYDVLGRMGLNVPRDAVTFDNDLFHQQGIVFWGAAGSAGKMFELFNPLGAGPLRLAFMGTGLIEGAYYSANAAGDATMALDYRNEPTGIEAAVLAGRTRNLSPVGDFVIQDPIWRRNIKPGLYMSDSDHLGVQVRAPVPGTNSEVELGAFTRKNTLSIENQLQAGINTEIAGHAATVRGGYKIQDGMSALEYRDERRQVEATIVLTPELAAFGFCQDVKSELGGATLQSQGCLVGARLVPLGGGGEATVDFLIGGKDKGQFLTQLQLDSLVRAITAFKEKIIPIADQAQTQFLAYSAANPSSPDFNKGLDQLSASIGQMSLPEKTSLLDSIAKLPLSQGGKTYVSEAFQRAPQPTPQDQQQTKQLLIDHLGTDARLNPNQQTNPNTILSGPEYDKALNTGNKISNYYTVHRGDILDLLTLLADQSNLQRAINSYAVSYVRSLIAGIQIKLPFISQYVGPMQLKDPALLAMISIERGRANPVPGILKSDLPEIRRDITTPLASYFGLGGDATSAQIVAAAIDRAQGEVAKQVNTQLLPYLDKKQTMDGIQAAQSILKNLSPPDQASLQKIFGPNLGLDNATPEKIRAYATTLPQRFGDWLRANVAGYATDGLENAIQYFLQAARRFNLTLLTAMRASEELDRLRISRGLHGAELSTRFFGHMSHMEKERRDRRRKGPQYAPGRSNWADMEFERALEASRRELTRWPNLRIEVSDRDWRRLCENYNPERLVWALDNISSELPAGKSVVLELGFDMFGGANMVSRRPNGHFAYALDAPSVAFDRTRWRGAANKLDQLMDLVGEAAAR